jgi:hypothetical protein
MSKDPYFTMLDTALAHVSRHAERADKLAYAIYGILGGDDPEAAAQLLADYGYTDEFGEWISDE